MGKIGMFKCTKCGRTFKMAPHLGRHMATMHGTKAKRAGRAPIGRPSTKRGPVAFGGATLLTDVGGWRDQLAAEHGRLGQQISALDDLLATLGGAGPRPVMTRHVATRARAGSLKSYIERVLRSAGKALARKDIKSAVIRAGYQSKNKTLGKTVGVALREMPNVAKVARGQYRLRG